jgi:hypothetical protein
MEDPVRNKQNIRQFLFDELVTRTQTHYEVQGFYTVFFYDSRCGGVSLGYRLLTFRRDLDAF